MDRELGLLGWSQAELARRLDVKAATVTSWRHRGAPRAVVAYLEAMVRLRELGERALALTARTKGRPRGKDARRVDAGGEAPVTVYERPPEDYAERVERWQEADLDQSDEWGKG